MAQADWASITCRGQQQITFAAKPQALLQSLSQGTRAIRVSFPRRAVSHDGSRFRSTRPARLFPSYCNKVIYRIPVVSAEADWGTPGGGGKTYAKSVV